MRLITNEQLLENGLECIKQLYQTDSEVSGGEYCDYLVGNLDEYFEPRVTKSVVMDAIQRFRSWDCEEGEEEVFQSAGTNWHYADGVQLPVGIRVGVMFQKELLLDEGVCLP